MHGRCTTHPPTQSARPWNVAPGRARPSARDAETVPLRISQKDRLRLMPVWWPRSESCLTTGALTQDWQGSISEAMSFLEDGAITVLKQMKQEMKGSRRWFPRCSRRAAAPGPRESLLKPARVSQSKGTTGRAQAEAFRGGRRPAPGQCTLHRPGTRLRVFAPEHDTDHRPPRPPAEQDGTLCAVPSRAGLWLGRGEPRLAQRPGQPRVPNMRRGLPRRPSPRARTPHGAVRPPHLPCPLPLLLLPLPVSLLYPHSPGGPRSGRVCAQSQHRESQRQHREQHKRREHPRAVVCRCRGREHWLP